MRYEGKESCSFVTIARCTSCSRGIDAPISAFTKAIVPRGLGTLVLIHSSRADDCIPNAAPDTLDLEHPPARDEIELKSSSSLHRKFHLITFALYSASRSRNRSPLLPNRPEANPRPRIVSVSIISGPAPIATSHLFSTYCSCVETATL